VQTPQIFRADILRTAYERAAGDDFTDDATAVESVGYSVMLCAGERKNIKITEADDLIIAEAMTKIL
jgi:2-C-methyl-D-erythritol 4-phosphate cytidylyltransferase